MKRLSGNFTGNGLGPQPEQKGKENSISAQASANEIPLDEATRMRVQARPEPHPTVGEESNEHAFRRSVPVIETDFAELSDGRSIAMIEDPRDPASSLFAVFKDGTLTYEATVSCGNRLYAPFRRDGQILKHIRFPQGVVAGESMTKVHEWILGLLLLCLDIPPAYAYLVSFFILSTHFPELLPVAPYLCIVGPPQSGKTTMLELLNQLCRHPLLTADFTSAALYDVYNKLTPTLLIDETLTIANKRALFHFLKAGFTRRAATLRKDRSVDLFGPKVISCTEVPDDRALVSRCVIIPMMESGRTDLKKPSESWVLGYTAKLRCVLLDYRLRNLRSLRLPDIEADKSLSSRTRDLYQALALPVGSNEMYCKFLIDHLKHQQEVNREPLSPASATTLRNLNFVIHSNPDAVKCAHKDLTMTTDLNPGSLPLTAHEIGRALTALGFTDRKRTNAGYVLWLELRTRKRIHQLAHEHGIDQEEWFKEGGFSDNCLLCRELSSADRGSAEGEPGGGPKSA